MTWSAEPADAAACDWRRYSYSDASVRRSSDVEVDPVQMEQVMMNIVVNARDAMPFGGLLTIRTDTVFIHGGRHTGHLPDVSTGRFVCMTIEDTGVGMSEDVREKVFDPFLYDQGAGQGYGPGTFCLFMAS